MGGHAPGAPPLDPPMSGTTLVALDLTDLYTEIAHITDLFDCVTSAPEVQY